MKKGWAVLVLGCGVGAANAVLVDQGSTTLDTVTGLEWLDLSFTNGMSYSAVSAQLGAGGSFAGYRYATQAEANVLLPQTGVPIISNKTYSNPEPAPSLALFDSLLGLTFGGLGGKYAFYGEIADMYAAYPGYHALLSASPSYFNTYTPAAAVTGAAGDALVGYGTTTVGVAPGYASNGVASFLVRPATVVTPVPEPATWGLMAAGLLGLGLTRRRRG